LSRKTTWLQDSHALPRKTHYRSPRGQSSDENTRQKAGFSFYSIAGAGLAPATSRLCIPLRLSSPHAPTDEWIRGLDYTFTPL